MAPIILSRPESITAKAGQTVTFKVKAEAIPEANYQWFKNDKVVDKATNAILKIDNITPTDSSVYLVLIKSVEGSHKSQKAGLIIK